MVDPQQPRRPGSDVLDAIWEKVAQKPERTDAATMLFRSKALDQLDVAAEVDNQLPLVSRRNWLLLVGVGALVLALLAWAALTPSVTSIPATGRVVAVPGVSPVVAPVAGVLVAHTAVPGTAVRAGQEVALLRTAAGDVPVTTVAPGDVWQLLGTPGAAVAAGATLLTLLPPASANTVLLPVPEAQAAAIVPGMAVDVFTGVRHAGSVAEVGPPLPAADVAARTGFALPPTTNYRVVTVTVADALPPGATASSEVILSDSTVMGRLLGQT